MILTVLEHQKINIGNKRDLLKNQISKSDAEIIRIIDLKNNGIFKWGNNYVAPQQWVGVISFSNFSIEILPKISTEKDANKSKEVLLYMLKVAYDIPTKKNISGEVDLVKNGLIEILITNYIKKIEQYVKTGLSHSYKKNIQSTKAIKGSVDFSRQMNKNILVPTKFICKYSKLDINNNLNQLIKFVLLEMKKISKDSNNVRQLSNILLHFRDVETLSREEIAQIKIIFNRNTIRTKEIIEFSKLFIDGQSISLNSGEHRVDSLLFDMNKIFELYIFKCCKKLFGNNVLFQNKKYYLLENKNNGNKKILLKPDILIKDDKDGDVIIDTKWKIINSFAKESDIYQMNAYLSGIPKSKIAMLIYPQIINSKSIIGEYNILDSSENKKIFIQEVDLSTVTDNVVFTEHLKDIIIKSRSY